MSYGRHPYGGVGYAAADVAEIPQADTETILAVEVAFTTGALETPVWVDVTSDVRSWDVQRGRNRELERFQPGRATVVLENLSRQYDSVYAAGPYFGNIKPMRRVRIRETFNGVTYPTFDGFVDRWELGYPGTGKDATATVTATDIKVLARTDLPRSVYDHEVLADAPEFRWRFNENLAEGDEERVALNSGTVGTAGDGTYIGGITFNAEPMVVGDPGQGIGATSSDVFAGVVVAGVNIPAAQINLLSRVNSRAPFTLEVWVRPKVGQSQALIFFMRDPTGTISSFALFWFNDTGAGNSGEFLWRLAKGAANSDLESGNSTAPPGARYHLVLTGEQEGANLRRRMYLNGVQVATDTVATSTYDSTGVDHNKWAGGVVPGSNFTGDLQEGAIYLQALTSTRVLVHYESGAHPWQGDLPGARLDRVLDIAGWPSAARQLDDGATTLQSADLGAQTVLEHSQRIGETEFGLLFIDRAGNVRFVSRAAVFARTAGPETFGDGAGEVGYREFVPSDGDDVIRNRAIISRLNGVAQTDEDTASVEEFGRFDYRLEGLLHQSDSYSLDYAEFIVAEYKDPRRRIATLAVGPPVAGEEDTVYPAMLGPELGDVITVTNTPVGGGDPFEQVCVIEGIQASGTPGGDRQTTFILSPDFAASF